MPSSRRTTGTSWSGSVCSNSRRSLRGWAPRAQLRRPARAACRAGARLRRPASPLACPPADGPGGPEAVGAEVALLRAQRAALEPRADPRRVRPPARVLPLAGPRQRARAAARGAARARRARAARARRLAHRARRPAGSRSARGTFLNLGVQVAAVELVEIGAHCMFANGCFVTDGNHRFDDPDRPVPWQGFSTKGPTRIGDNVWCGANVVITSGVTRRRPLRDRRELGRHARPAAVLDRRRRARDGAQDDRIRIACAPMGPEEQGLVDAIAAREDDLVALLCDLIRFDTTSRDDPGAPARDEAALQAHLAGRLGAGRRGRRRLGARPRRRRGPSGHPGGRDRLRGPAAARRALPRPRPRRVAAAERPHRRRPRPARGRLGPRPVRPAGPRRPASAAAAPAT